MFDFFRDLIGTQPILTVFLAIGSATLSAKRRYPPCY
jgi:hypothetical protein